MLIMLKIVTSLRSSLNSEFGNAEDVKYQNDVIRTVAGAYTQWLKTLILLSQYFIHLKITLQQYIIYILSTTKQDVLGKSVVLNRVFLPYHPSFVTLKFDLILIKKGL